MTATAEGSGSAHQEEGDRAYVKDTVVKIIRGVGFIKDVIE